MRNSHNIAPGKILPSRDRKGAILLTLALLLVIPQLFAVQENEHLHYNINWPSGLNLGEAQLRSVTKKGNLDMELTIDAGVPGFPVTDRYHALATAGMCAIEFEKDLLHGKKKIKEITKFDAVLGVAVRETNGGGGKTESPIGPCAKDALSYLGFIREELAKGRVPAPQTIYFGGAYTIRIQHAGTQKVMLPEGPVEVDKLVASVKGKASDVTFEIYIAKDRSRTPVLVKAPLAMGVFSMELVR